jgi:hypothetical protein
MWFSIAAATFSASALFAAQVRSNYDRNVDFGRYKTYSWEKIQTQDQLWADRIKAAVNSALAAKGWTNVESSGDVSIMAMEMRENHRTLDTYYGIYEGGWGWRWGGGFGKEEAPVTTEETYKIGTLVVDLFDQKTKKLIWRGSVADTLTNKSDQNVKNLDRNVLKLFNHLPAQTSRGRLSEKR